MKSRHYKRVIAYALIIIAIFVLSGCSKPYVGMTVNYDSKGICRVTGFPSECAINDESFVVYIKINKLDDNGNYRIEGYFDPTSGSLKSWDNLVRQKSRFTMIFASNNVIFDNKVLPIRGMDMGQKFTFDFEYHTELSIDAVTFTYNILVSG